LCDYVRFIGNTFFIGGAGIDLTATTQAIITGNTFKNLVTGISLRTATSGVNVQSNSYNNVTTHISNLGTGNTLGGGST
jgi:nitrous oxidase accessory protein NosD